MPVFSPVLFLRLYDARSISIGRESNVRSIRKVPFLEWLFYLLKAIAPTYYSPIAYNEAILYKYTTSGLEQQLNCRNRILQAIRGCFPGMSYQKA
jgi:hypothetical protein